MLESKLKKKTGVSVDSYGNEIKDKTTVTFNKDTKEKTNIYGDQLMKSMKDLMN